MLRNSIIFLLLLCSTTVWAQRYGRMYNDWGIEIRQGASFVFLDPVNEYRDGYPLNFAMYFGAMRSMGDENVTIGFGIDAVQMGFDNEHFKKLVEQDHTKISDYYRFNFYVFSPTFRVEKLYGNRNWYFRTAASISYTNSKYMPESGTYYSNYPELEGSIDYELDDHSKGNHSGVGFGLGTGFGRITDFGTIGIGFDAAYLSYSVPLFVSEQPYGGEKATRTHTNKMTAVRLTPTIIFRAFF